MVVELAVHTIVKWKGEFRRNLVFRKKISLFSAPWRKTGRNVGSRRGMSCCRRGRLTVDTFRELRFKRTQMYSSGACTPRRVYAIVNAAYARMRSTVHMRASCDTLAGSIPMLKVENTKQTGRAGWALTTSLMKLWDTHATVML